jgi:hypothetical protein
MADSKAGTALTASHMTLTPSGLLQVDLPAHPPVPQGRRPARRPPTDAGDVSTPRVRCFVIGPLDKSGTADGGRYIEATFYRLGSLQRALRDRCVWEPHGICLDQASRLCIQRILMISPGACPSFPGSRGRRHTTTATGARSSWSRSSPRQPRPLAPRERARGGCPTRMASSEAHDSASVGR